MEWGELGLGSGVEKGTQIWRLGFMKPLSRAPDSSRVCGQLAMQKNRLSLLNHRGLLTPHRFTRLSLIYRRSEVLMKSRDDGLFCLCPFPNTKHFIAASDTAMHATIISLSFHLKTLYHKHLLQNTQFNAASRRLCSEKIWLKCVCVCVCVSVRMKASVCVYLCTSRLQAPIVRQHSLVSGSTWLLTPSQKDQDSNPYVLGFSILKRDIPNPFFSLFFILDKSICSYTMHLMHHACCARCTTYLLHHALPHTAHSHSFTLYRVKAATTPSCPEREVLVTGLCATESPACLY